MRIFEIDSMPRIQFAHVYGVEDYTTRFSVNERRMEVTLVTEGALSVKYEDEKYLAQAGDIICSVFERPYMVRADGYHQHHTVSATIDWRMTDNVAGGLYLPIVTRAKESLHGAESIIELLIGDSLTYQDSPTRGAIQFLNLLYEIDKCNRKSRELIIPGEVLYTQRAKQYVQEHLHEPICQSDVAKHLSITPEYLCAVFKKTEGRSVMRFINETKLMHIRAIMAEHNVPLIKAAEIYGFADPNYVSKLHKKYYNETITQAIKNLRR